MTATPQNLTPAQLVQRWNGAVSIGTLSNWRAQGKGPAYLKFGRSVRYPLRAVELWERQNMHLVGANDNGSALAGTEPNRG